MPMIKGVLRLTLQKRKANIKNEINARLFLLPALLFFFVFIAYPVVFILYGSLFQWSTLANLSFVGLGNYTELLQDNIFHIVLKNAGLWILFTIFIQMVLGFILAYIIEEKLSRTKGFFRTVYFIPVVTSVVAIAILFKNMFSPYQGLITNALRSLGIGGAMNFLGDSKSVIFSIIFVNIWEWTGWSMVLYIAGISQISSDVKEAAQIDGANGLKMIFHIHLPLLSATHKSLIMLGIIGSLQTFALVYSMTMGGPNNASHMPGTYIFKTGFQVQKMGYASAISVVILLIALILTALQVSFLHSGNFIGKGASEHA